MLANSFSINSVSHNMPQFRSNRGNIGFSFKLCNQITSQGCLTLEANAIDFTNSVVASNTWSPISASHSDNTFSDSPWQSKRIFSPHESHTFFFEKMIHVASMTLRHLPQYSEHVTLAWCQKRRISMFCTLIIGAYSTFNT